MPRQIIRAAAFSCIVLTLLSGGLVFGSVSAGENGVTETEIKIGGTGAKSGPAGLYTTRLEQAARAYFERINAQGGIYGRKINFSAMDDGYDPKKAMENAKHLIENEKVFTLFSGNGSATAKAVLPVTTKANVPLVFHASGADFMYDSKNKNLFTLRPSYLIEAEGLIGYAVENLKKTKFGVLYQDDAYGQAGLWGVTRALKELGKDPKLAEGKFVRNKESTEADFAHAIKDLIVAHPDVVYIQTLNQPAIFFIKLAAAKGFTPIYMTNSSLDPEMFSDQLKDYPNEIYLSQVVPYARAEPPQVEIVKLFQEDMKKLGISGVDLDWIRLEGYAAAAVYVEGLRRAGKNLTRETLRTALESMHPNVDVHGLKISLSPTNHMALTTIFPVLVKKGKVSAMVPIKSKFNSTP